MTTLKFYHKSLASKNISTERFYALECGTCELFSRILFYLITAKQTKQLGMFSGQ